MVNATPDISPVEELAAALRKAAAACDDLTVPLHTISQQWFASNRAIFDLQGPGKYEDLSPKYAKQKARALGSAYPILKWSGKLATSITDPTSPDAVSYIVNKTAVVLGSKVTSDKGAPYAFFLHYGTSKMPARPVVLLGNEQVADGALTGRIDQWRALLLAWAVGNLSSEAQLSIANRAARNG